MQKVVECQITSEHDVRDIDRNVSGVAQTAYELENGYLVFPLTERYSVSNTISISQLTGHDQLLAHVFQSLDFIDVHLAVISLSISADKQTRSSNSSEDSENLALKSVGVQQWIGFEDSFPQGSVYDFGACSQLIGTTQHYLSESYGANGEMLLYHYALIVQPRRQSITSSCLYNFDRALDCLEYRLWSLLRLSRPKRPSKRNLLKSDLMQMISFCADEPASVFRTSAPRAEKRSLRMLTLCLHLRAREETMAFLNLLGTGFTCDTSNDKPISSKPVLVYEGLRCEDCSRVVADLEYRVVGNVTLTMFTFSSKFNSFLSQIGKLLQV